MVRVQGEQVAESGVAGTGDLAGTVDYCPGCGMRSEHVLVLAPELTSYGKVVCARCERFIRWQATPGGEASKYRRPQKHRTLVRKFSLGYCEMCLTPEPELGSGQVLEAHHVLPQQSGGSDARENVWVLCTNCHRQVHWLRSYVGRKSPLG